MCGRYTLLTPDQVLEIQAIVREAEERVRQRNTQNVLAQPFTGEVRPTMPAPILILEGDRMAASPAYWGYTGWRSRAKRPDKDGKFRLLKPKVLFNTRDDTATKAAPTTEWEKIWAESLRERRCVIPTTGFYETQYPYAKKPGERPITKGIPYFFWLPEEKVTYIAGIWRPELDGETGTESIHFSMMTTEANNSVAGVHGRMPVVLREYEINEWASGDYHSLLNRCDVHIEGKIA